MVNLLSGLLSFCKHSIATVLKLPAVAAVGEVLQCMVLCMAPRSMKVEHGGAASDKLRQTCGDGGGFQMDGRMWDVQGSEEESWADLPKVDPSVELNGARLYRQYQV